ncbi:head completion/stabilization protein [Desulfoluna spongiiphila]|uniref:Phage head completion protein (GPL) n=1 Tax=Desulfoluna spongiiphila TaxID=419481 RepID=A0A1G5G3B4_9BACT|nr:head completion/stabilization protein [Desulfoluna spongiiphila]SCY46076.1 Phage head completion protein (GPL) [Desulfoluna spongiiphila]
MPGFTGISNQIDPTAVVKNAPFWPDINLAEFQAAYRLPPDYSDGLLKDRLSLAMLWANGELKGFQHEQQQTGVQTLDEVPVDDGERLGGVHPKVMHYTRAVCCHAKALLLADYATLHRRNDAQADTMESPEAADRWRSESFAALSQIRESLSIMVEAL